MIATQPSSPSSTARSAPRRRPSISNPIAWLARTTSTISISNGPTSTASAMRISEPQLISDIHAPVSGLPYVQPRYGALGSGATVVRTPNDALARMQAPVPPPNDLPGAAEDDGTSSYEDEAEPPSPSSLVLPPLPFTSKSSPNLPVLGEMPADAPSATRVPPARGCPPVPTVPLHVDTTPTQPQFAPVLLAPVPEILIDPSSLIITLETSTSSLRTTYATLTSRPSHLANYLQSLVKLVRDREKRSFRDTLVEEEEEDGSNAGEDDGIRLPSPDTPFSSLFNAHIASVGILPHSPGMIHLFLDRPSAPYAHVLAYLRTPSNHPSLPRAVCHQERVEDLYELRDEARYLGLEELHRLCCDIIRRRQGHVRGASSTGSVASHHAILHERGRGEVRVRVVANHRATPSQDMQGRGSMGSEVAQIVTIPTSPTSSVGARAKSPSARSRSRGTPRSASDWI